MYKILLGFLFCLLAPVFGRADAVYVDESGPEGTPPIVTFSPTISPFFLSYTVTPCPNVSVGECWNIDIFLAGTGLGNWGTPTGLELTEPGTGKLSDSFGPFTMNGNDLTFRLFSDDESGNIGGNAPPCQSPGCAQAPEDGTFQAANQGMVVSGHSFDVFLKSDVDGGGTTPEPATLLLLGTGLLTVAGKARRKWLSSPR